MSDKAAARFLSFFFKIGGFPLRSRKQKERKTTPHSSCPASSALALAAASLAASQGSLLLF